MGDAIPAIEPFPRGKNIVFLLGAGASVMCELPIMRRFMSAAFDRYYELKELQNQSIGLPPEDADGILESYELLFRFRQQCRASLWAFNRDWDNIEALHTGRSSEAVKRQ